MQARIRKIYRNESGQSAVLVAMLSGVLIFVIAMTTNMGKVVTEKIALQNSVDLAVYAGAATQASYMNEMRKVNDDIWGVINRTRRILQTGSAIPGAYMDLTKTLTPACPAGIPAPAGAGLTSMVADRIIDLAKAEIRLRSLRLEYLNLQANRQAYFAARDTANANYPGSGDLLQPYHNFRAKNVPVPLMKMEQVDVDLQYRAWCIPPPPYVGPPLPAVYTQGERIKGWYFKEDRGDVMYVAGIENAHPNSPFLDVATGYFFSRSCSTSGNTPRNGRCGMTVYAAAKPFYGKLGAMANLPAAGEMELNYSDEFPLQPGMTFMVDGPGRIRNFEPVRGNGGNYRDYKVRFVGLNDARANYTQYGGGFTIRNDPEFLPYLGRMKH